VADLDDLDRALLEPHQGSIVVSQHMPWVQTERRVEVAQRPIILAELLNKKFLHRRGAVIGQSLLQFT
jgi:hypothetical protein